MAKARELKRRMHSVENTRKITRTMEMVATSKLRRAQERVRQARPYAERLTAVLQRLITPELIDVEPLLRQPERVRTAAVLLITSNRGLCGAFNANLIRKARGLISRLEGEGARVELHAVGRKGVGYFRFRGVELASARQDIGDRPTLAAARSLTEGLARRFAAGELDAVYLVFAEFRSVVSSLPTASRILPAAIPEERDGGTAVFILDPSAREILASLFPLYITNTTYRALVETAAAEHGARRTAMKNATDNAEEFLGNLRRRYNRARQAEITQQIAEIIGGADALAE